MALFPILKTERLSIESFDNRRLTERYISWLNDPVVVRFSEQRHKKHTRESCLAFIQSLQDTPHFFCSIMTQEPHPTHIGNVTVMVDSANAVADVALLIGEREAWGKNYGTEVFRSVIDELLHNQKMRKVTAGTMSANVGMIMVMLKSGMNIEAIKPKHVLLEGKPVDLVYASVFADDSQ